MNLLFIGHPKETELALFAGGELGPLARWRIERHLQQCDGCQDAVADFFHLQSEVGELAEMPPVDWKALAQGIAARVRLEAPAEDEKARGWFAHPRVWQVGLATATLLCTIVVVRQLPTIRESAKEAAPPAVAESQAHQEAAVPEADGGRANQPLPRAAVPETAGTPVAAAQFARTLDEVSSRDNPARESNEAASGAVGTLKSLASDLRTRRDEALGLEAASERRAPPDVEAEKPPAAEPVAVQAENMQAENMVVAPASAVAPAPPAAADAGALQDRATAVVAGQSIVGGAAFRQPAEAVGQRKTERAELAQASASKAGPPTARLLARPAGLEKKADADGVWNPERGFTVPPAALQDPAVDVGVAADGWISIRAVDANTGTITITDVYVP